MQTNAPTDSAWLPAWMHPAHACADAMIAAQRAFASHPLRVNVVQTFLHPERARQLSAFLSDDARYEEVSDPLYRMSVLAGVRDDRRLDDGVITYLRFMQALEDRRFAETVEALSGLALGPAVTTVHAMRAGDYLLPHDDDIENRRLAFVFFLTPDWPDDGGGMLRFMQDGHNAVTIRPVFNSFAYFDVTASSRHQVDHVTSAAGRLARLTISGWFLNPR